MAAKYPDQEFLEFLIKSLVDSPDAVEVNRKVDEMGVLLTLKVGQADMGKVLGRLGNTAKAIRTLLRVVGIKNNARVNLKIDEPEGGRGPRPMRSEGEPRGGDSRGGGRGSASMDDVMEDLKL